MITDNETEVFDYGIPVQGINLHNNFVSITSRDAILMKNLIRFNGIRKRLGYAKVSVNEVAAGNKIDGLHRFYYQTDGKQLLVASGTFIKKFNDPNWENIDGGGSVGQTQTAGTQTYFSIWGALNKVYISNGVDRAMSYLGDEVPLEAGITLVRIRDYTLIDAGVDSVSVQIDGVTTTKIEGSGWTAATSNAATATSLASSLNGISGISAAAVDDLVTITADLTAHLQDVSTSMDSTEATLTKNFLGPSKALQFLSYQDRLLAIDPNNPGEIIWSKSFDDNTWETRAATGVRPDPQLFGMIHHSLSNTDTGPKAAVLLAGSAGMYLFQGTNLATPSTTGDYTIQTLATNIGCNAPRTMVWTPRGSLYLGIDRSIYLLPFDESVPIPVSRRIESGINGVDGIESIPAAQISKACAVYHDGYYKIAFARTGETTNTTQFWLDIDKLEKMQDESYGPWYGPMEGMTISCFANQNGPGDSGELMAGEDTAATGSFVYEGNKPNTFGDVGAAIDIYYQSFFNPLGKPALGKDVHLAEIEMLDSASGVTLDCIDIDSTLSIDNAISSDGYHQYWNDYFWGEDYWKDVSPVRSRISISPPFQCRKCAVVIKHSSSTENFVLYEVRVSASEQRSIFVGRGK